MTHYEARRAEILGDVPITQWQRKRNRILKPLDIPRQRKPRQGYTWVDERLLEKKSSMWTALRRLERVWR